MPWTINGGASIFGSRPANAQQAIAAQANAKRAAANTGTGSTRDVRGVAYGGGPLTQDKNKFTPARGGTMGTSSSQPIAPMGYDPGSFNDPTIDWQSIYDTFIGSQQQQPSMIAPSSPGRVTGSGRTSAESVGLAAAPSLFVPPESITAPPATVQPPAVVANATPSEVNVPGESFTSIGGPGSFGSFERKRAVRGPRTGLSVTPEMIRRAAAQRLG
jgi:hypothetical protein